MMKHPPAENTTIHRTLKIVSTIVVLATGASVAIMAQEKPKQTDKAVKARKAVMQIYSFNLGLLSAMAKEVIDSDAQTAIDAAWNINATALTKNGPM